MALDLHNVYGISLSYLRDVTDPKHALLVIPEAQMAEFQRFVEISKGEFDVEQDAQYVKGDMVIVTNGPLKGITGELLKIEKKNKVVVRLQNLIACSVTIDLSDLEKVNGLV